MHRKQPHCCQASSTPTHPPHLRRIVHHEQLLPRGPPRRQHPRPPLPQHPPQGSARGAEKQDVWLGRGAHIEHQLCVVSQGGHRAACGGGEHPAQAGEWRRRWVAGAGKELSVIMQACRPTSCRKGAPSRSSRQQRTA